MKRTSKEIRESKGGIDVAKVRAATEEQIARWKREEGIDDGALGPARFVVPTIDVRELRERLQLSQEEFAKQFRLSLRTIQEWEQHRREPSEPARVLLYAIARAPKVIARALH